MEDKIIKSDTQIVTPIEKEEIDSIIKQIASTIIESL